MATKKPETVLEVLKAARRLISVKKRWTQGTLARSKSGRQIDVFSRAAVKFCAYGAIYRVGGYPAPSETFQKLDNQCNGNSVSVNDVDGHKAILAAFDRAIEAAS